MSARAWREQRARVRELEAELDVAKDARSLVSDDFGRSKIDLLEETFREALAREAPQLAQRVRGLLGSAYDAGRLAGTEAERERWFARVNDALGDTVRIVRGGGGGGACG